MKNLLLFAGTALLCLNSCQGPALTPMTENEKKAKADSIIGTKIQDLMVQSMEDLDRRKSIEVKAKADSIVAAYQKSLQPDTTKK